MNSFNSVRKRFMNIFIFTEFKEIFIFDSNYIGAILRFKPKNTEAEK